MNNTFNNLIASIGTALAGTLAPLIAESSEIRIPLLLMDIFQLLSWSAAIVIGAVTLLKWLKNRKK